jgi:transposase-like protein
MSEYWDAHDLTEHWDEGKDVHFDVDIKSEVTYCALERDLSEKVRAVAKRHGVSSDTIVNMWVQDRLLTEV